MYNEVMEVVNQAKKADTRQSSTSDLRHMSAQTIFSVLDYLTKWRTHRILMLTAGVPMGRGEQEFVSGFGWWLSEFLCVVCSDKGGRLAHNFMIGRMEGSDCGAKFCFWRWGGSSGILMFCQPHRVTSGLRNAIVIEWETGREREI